MEIAFVSQQNARDIADTPGMFHHLNGLIRRYPICFVGLSVWFVTVAIGLLFLSIILADEHLNLIPPPAS